MAIAPSGAPDEDSHYVRMVGLSSGQLLGRPVPADAPVPPPFSSTTGFARRRLNLESGIYVIPASAPAPPTCNQFQPHRPYDCAIPSHTRGAAEARSFHARTLPVAEIFPAVASRVAATSLAKMYTGRIAFLVESLTLLGVGLVVLGPVWPVRGDAFTTILLLLSTTPLMMFGIGSLSPSAVETPATVAVACVTLRLFIQPTRRVALVAAFVNPFAILTWDLGFALTWYAILLGAAASSSVNAVVGNARDRRLLVIPTLSTLTATGFAVTWRLVLQVPVEGVTITGSSLLAAVRATAAAGRDSIAKIGAPDVDPLPWLSRLWLVGLVIAIAAFSLLRRRVRLTLAAYIGWAAYNLALYLVVSPTGFGLQARYSLPMLSVASLTIGLSSTYRSPGERERRHVWLVALVTSAVALGHLSVLVFAVHRTANGTTGPWSLSSARFAPPGGWWIPISLGVSASAMLLIAAWRPIVARTRSETSPL